MADAADVTKVVTTINGSIEVYTPHTKKRYTSTPFL